MSKEKSDLEKGPTFLIQKDALIEHKPREKLCTRSFVIKLLALLLVALLVTLFIEFLFPFIERRYRTSVIDVIEVYDDSKPPPEEPWQLEFLINPTGLCDSSPEGVKLLVLVPSATDHFEKRDAIRKTWGSLATKGSVRLGFVLGKANESSRIAEESARFGDVIQSSLADESNRTAKSVLLLRWAAAHCAHAQYVLKAEDDTFVNMDVVEKVMAKEPTTHGRSYIWGFMHMGEPDSSLPYVKSSSYLTTGSTASRLFDAAQRVRPMLPRDNLYVTGLCAQDIHAHLVHEPCFRDAPLQSSWDSIKSLATIRTDSPEDMEKLWYEMTKVVVPEDDSSNVSSSIEEDEKQQQQALFDLFDWADKLLGDVDESSEETIEETYEPSVEEKDGGKDNFFDSFSSSDSSDLSSLISNLLIKNRLGFDDDGSSSNAAISTLPNQRIIIGSIRSRLMLPNFQDKIDGFSGPIQRLMMGLSPSFLTSSKSDGGVDLKQIMGSNSLSSLLSGFNGMNSLNMRQSSGSSFQSSGIESNNMDSMRQSQSIMTGGVQSKFRAPENGKSSLGIQRGQEDLPDWPGSQGSSIQTLGFNSPIRWQRTYVIPLSLNQASRVNATNYL